MSVAGGDDGTLRAQRIACAERLIDARQRGDIEAVLRECTDDVSYRIMGRLGDRPLLHTLTGTAAMRQELGGIFERWIWKDVTLDNILCDGASVVVEVAGTKIYGVTGQMFEDANCILLEFAGEKIRAIREYFDTFTVIRVGGISM